MTHETLSKTTTWTKRIVSVALLEPFALIGCSKMQRIEATECTQWLAHVDDVVLAAVKSAAEAGCTIDANEVKADIAAYVENDCAEYDNNKTVRRSDFDCMMKVATPADLDECYDAIAVTTTSTKTKTKSAMSSTHPRGHKVSGTFVAQICPKP